MPLPTAATPLTMTACADNEGIVTPLSDPARSISLLINPSQLQHERKTCFSQQAPLGDTGSGLRFSHMRPGKLSFSAIFDGTGVVPRPAGSLMPLEVEDQLDAMATVIYDYDGLKHEPSIVQVLWGLLSFVGRLQSFNTEYTLFRPSGAPLRATASLSFMSYVSRQEAQLDADASSPDLSHTVEVREGDTLPLLCHRIYGDSRYYPQVARFNHLSQFRVLRPGLQLHFPPLG